MWKKVIIEESLNWKKSWDIFNKPTKMWTLNVVVAVAVVVVVVQVIAAEGDAAAAAAPGEEIQQLFIICNMS